VGFRETTTTIGTCFPWSVNTSIFYSDDDMSMKKYTGAPESKKALELIFAVKNFGRGSGVMTLRLGWSQEKALALHFGSWKLAPAL